MQPVKTSTRVYPSEDTWTLEVIWTAPTWEETRFYYGYRNKTTATLLGLLRRLLGRPNEGA